MIFAWVTAFLILVSFWLPNILFSSSPFEKARLRVIDDPENPLAHLTLAEIAADSDDWRVARTEYEQALNHGEPKAQARIAGTNSYFEVVGRKVFAVRLILKEIKEWKTILEEQPGYRDGHLRLALLYYQLSNYDLAVLHWRTSWSLDPNNEQVMAVGKILGIAEL